MPSMVVMLRAAVMLCCLVVVPAVALLGTDLSQLATEAWQSRSSAAVVVPVASDARPPAASAGLWPPPEAETSAPQPQIAVAAAAAPVPAAAMNHEVQPASPPHTLAAAAGSQPAALVFPATVPVPAPVSQAAHPAELAQGQNYSQQGSGVVPASGVAGEAPDPFAHVQHRLRELGAVYYKLETWGRTGQLYRFQCEMAVEGHPQMRQHFEATEVDALRAMENVVRQVEASQPRLLR